MARAACPSTEALLAAYNTSWRPMALPTPALAPRASTLLVRPQMHAAGETIVVELVVIIAVLIIVIYLFQSQTGDQVSTNLH
jgi:hypothetical protein